MRTACLRYEFALVAAVTLVLMFIAPTHAAYDKAYRFALPEGWDPDQVNAVRAITNALEIVTSQYDGWRNPWEPGVVGYPIIGGAYSTRIAYNTLREPQWNPQDPTQQWTWDMAIKVGWSVSDVECRLRDLKWVTSTGTSTVNVLGDLSAVPGGGELLWDPPEWPGQWVWRIWNESDTGLPLPLHGVELAVLTAPLSHEELAFVTEEGTTLADQVTANVGRMIADLRASVGATALPPGWITSLTGKLDNAMADKLAGDALYRPPAFDIDGALLLWGRAAQHVATFASQIRSDGEAKGRKWEVPAEWAEAADGIAAALLALPGVISPDLRPPGVNELVRTAAAETQSNAVASIPAGSYVDLVLDEVVPGDAVVLSGDVTDGAGNIILEWIEQVVVVDDIFRPTLMIDPTPVDGRLENPGTVRVWIVEADAEYLYWSVVSSPAEEPVLYQDPWSVELQFPDPGEYVLMAVGRDRTGLLSEPMTVNITVGPTYAYTVTDLGNLGGAYPSTYPEAINEAGVVVGGSIAAGGSDHAFLWDGTMHDLGVLDEDLDTSWAYDINDQGVVCGESEKWDEHGTNRHAFVYDGVLHDIHPDGWAASSCARAVNNSGQVAISSTEASCRSWIHDPLGGMQEIAGFFADDISDSGILAGLRYTTNGFAPCLYVFGSIMDLALPSNRTQGRACAINNYGEVAGETRSGYSYYACFWDQAGYPHEIGYDRANAINDAGQVVLDFYIWDATNGKRSLNTLIDPSLGWRVRDAYDINNRGQIVATATHPQLPGTRGVLLTPTQ